MGTPLACAPSSGAVKQRNPARSRFVRKQQTAFFDLFFALNVDDNQRPYSDVGFGGTQLELVAITETGEPARPVPSTPQVAAEAVEATTQLYRIVGYEPPWIGYLAIENDTCVGMCAFKSPPQNNRVEIAYFTLPGYESRGVATRMASELIRLALDHMPGVTVAAQTLPEESASTSVLKKLQLRLVGTVEHPEDGLVWEWQLTDTSEA